MAKTYLIRQFSLTIMNVNPSTNPTNKRRPFIMHLDNDDDNDYKCLNLVLAGRPREPLK